MAGKTGKRTGRSKAGAKVNREAAARRRQKAIQTRGSEAEKPTYREQIKEKQIAAKGKDSCFSRMLSVMVIVAAGAYLLLAL